MAAAVAHFPPPIAGPFLSVGRTNGARSAVNRAPRPALRRRDDSNRPVCRRIRVAGQVSAEPVTVPAEDESALPVDGSAPRSMKLFVGNLSPSVNAESLSRLFSGAGTVETAEVIYDYQTGQSRGFGFVTMGDFEALDNAIKMFNDYEVDGRNISVNKATPRGSRPLRNISNAGRTYKLYVGNLSWQVDDTQLMDLFREYGNVIDAQVVCARETGRSRGFGFVRMSSDSKPDDIKAALNGKILDGRPIIVDVAERKR